MTIENIIIAMRALVDADSTAYPAAALTDIGTIRINQAYEEIVGDLIALDRNWKFDDSNYTDLPIGTGTLVAGQQDYGYSVALLSVERVEVLDANGNYQKLTYLDEKDIDTALSEHYETDGMPIQYALRGSSIFLYPAPATGSVTMALGLRVYYQRTASTYTAAQITAGTKEPGFASPYHILIAYKAALPYALTYKKDRVPMIMAEIQKLEQKMFVLASNRFRDKKSRMTASVENCR